MLGRHALTKRKHTFIEFDINIYMSEEEEETGEARVWDLIESAETLGLCGDEFATNMTWDHEVCGTLHPRKGCPATLQGNPKRMSLIL